MNKHAWLEQVLADPEVGDLAIRLALVLTTYINNQSGEAWPSQETLIARCRASRSGVQNALYKLRDRGHILVEVVGGRTHTNRYRLNARIAQEELPMPQSERAHPCMPFNGVNGPPENALSDAKGPSTVAERAHQNDIKGLPGWAQNSKKNLKKNLSAYSEAFETFWQSYPVDAGMSKLEASKAWEKLSGDERVTALTCIPGFKAWMAKQGKDYRTLHACRYLSQKRFEGITAVATPEKWDHAKYKAIIPLVKQRRVWSTAYPPPSTIPADLIDDELQKILQSRREN